jgi:hypothetical protein
LARRGAHSAFIIDSEWLGEVKFVGFSRNPRFKNRLIVLAVVLDQRAFAPGKVTDFLAICCVCPEPMTSKHGSSLRLSGDFCELETRLLAVSDVGG